MGRLMPYEIIAFLLCCIDCYIIYKKKNANTTKKILYSLIVSIFAVGIFITLMMYYAMEYLIVYFWLASLLVVTPIALFLLVSVLVWQSTILSKPEGSKCTIILSGLIIIVAYVLCWGIGVSLNPPGRIS